MMRAYEEAFSVPAVAENVGLLGHIRNVVKSRLREGLLPIRLAITCTTQSGYECELGVIDGIHTQGVEDAEGVAWRKGFLRQIGYKAQ